MNKFKMGDLEASQVKFRKVFIAISEDRVFSSNKSNITLQKLWQKLLEIH